MRSLTELRRAWGARPGSYAPVVWALILILPGWLHAPYGREQRDVAAVYDALARARSGRAGRIRTGDLRDPNAAR